jgi:hypothetical protein
MTTLHEQARAEAEKRYDAPTGWGVADRDAFTKGFLAGHKAATRTRVVTTVDELAAMPRDYETIVRGNDGQVWQRSRNAWDCLSEDGTGGLRPSSAIALPARVLYDPEETR